MFLITGCGRSGTKYITKVLRQANIDVEHERAGTEGAVSSCWAHPVGPYPSFHAQERPHFDLVLHQVRDPLKTIGSIMTSSEESWRFNERALQIPKDMDLVHKSTLYWILWNKLAERQAVWTYRIEDLEGAWETLSWLLHTRVKYSTAAYSIPKDTNTREHPVITMDDIPLGRRDQLKRLARKYGYQGY